MEIRFFTSESVTEGHPDKMCDRISDAILDGFLEQDPETRMGCETTATTGLIHIMGECSSKAVVDIEGVVRRTVADVGYDNAAYGFDAKTCGVLISLHGQSQDISQGVLHAMESRAGLSGAGFEFGAGDQGMMFGYACDQTEDYMPLPIFLAHRLAQRLAQVRKEKILDYLRPDGKSQVTVQYENGVPVRVDTIVIAAQHSPAVTQNRIHRDILRQVIQPVIPPKLLDSRTNVYVNATGRFEIGGPMGDSGLTGRKIIVDTYGGFASHGGGAFSGKDPTKVDRSASYAARHAAKNIVAAGLARECAIELAYAIGVAKPLSVYINTHGSGLVPDDRLIEMVDQICDFRPASIIRRFQMGRPIYQQLASYGHFGRSELRLPWEALDLVDLFREYFAGKVR